MKKLLKWKAIIILALVAGIATLAWAGTVHRFPYGIANPYWYDYTPSTRTVGTYYMALPTLSANDTAVGTTSTQTLTNKTLTSPTITGASISSSTVISPTISGSITGSGVVSATNIADVVRHVQLPIMAFTHNGSAALTSSTAPGLEADDNVMNIVWADGETTPIQITFRVPSDYASGGAFKVFATESSSTTPNQVDFDVYVNADGTAADASATNQTPVALAGTTSTPDEITLTVATDFASLAAGHWVTFRIWRDDTATGTGDLEVKGGTFYYTATQ